VQFNGKLWLVGKTGIKVGRGGGEGVCQPLDLDGTTFLPVTLIRIFCRGGWIGNAAALERIRNGGGKGSE
jgi:hypothetical protein